MRKLVRLALAAAAVCGLPAVAQAKVKITVDLDSQTIHIVAKDRVYDWRVSSGKAGYETPTGTYGVLWMDKDHTSDEYNGVPMPNAIFFKPGFAIHGASKSPFGHPASHGCVRLPVAKSALLFELVKAEGGAEVTISGATPVTREAATPRRRAATENGAAPAPGYGSEEPSPAASEELPPPRGAGYDLYGQVY